jgi:putative holliday junction resolvase
MAGSESVGDGIPKQGRLLGVDHGAVRIGLAISDLGQQFSSPLTTRQSQAVELDRAWFRKLVKEEQIVGVIIGLAVHGDGRESKQSAIARKFGNWFCDELGLPVAYFDERFTSMEAKDFLMAAGATKKKRKEKLDRVAAQIMLKGYLESTRDGHAPGALGD